MKNVLEPTDGGGMLFNCPGGEMLGKQNSNVIEFKSQKMKSNLGIA